MLHDQIAKIIEPSICDSKNTRVNFLKRLGGENFTRDENPQTHYCAYFLPFLLTITPIENKVQPCKVHYDIWYLVLTDGSKFNVDPKEFHDTKWLTIDEAEKIVTDGPNRKALETIRKKYD